MWEITDQAKAEKSRILIRGAHEVLWRIRHRTNLPCHRAAKQRRDHGQRIATNMQPHRINYLLSKWTSHFEHVDVERVKKLTSSRIKSKAAMQDPEVEAVGLKHVKPCQHASKPNTATSRMGDPFHTKGPDHFEQKQSSS